MDFGELKRGRDTIFATAILVLMSIFLSAEAEPVSEQLVDSSPLLLEGKLMDERSTELVVRIAARFLDYASSAASEMDEAFLRYEVHGDHDSMSSTYREGEVGYFFDRDFDNDEVESRLDDDSRADFLLLRQSLADQVGRNFVVCLVRVTRTGEYNVYFEHEDSEKWMLSKLDGRTGIPNLD